MRKLAREIAFKMIFENIFRDSSIFNEDTFLDLKEDDKLEEVDSDFSKSVFDKFLENKEVLTEEIKPALNGFEFERAFKIDLALIFLALTEIKYIGTDKKIVINEIVNLAKKYSTEKSPSYVNGVLSTLVNKD